MINGLIISVISISWSSLAWDKTIPSGSLRIPEPGNVQIITTTDGSTNIGRITEITGSTVLFSTELGIITIPFDRIQSIREVPASSIRNGNYWFHDPNNTRLFFAPTGRMLKKGSGYFADYYLFFPSANYGVTNRLSLGGGFSIFPSGNMKEQVYFFTPKIGVKQTEKLNIAAGALVLKIPDIADEETPLLSIIYGAGTYGTADRSLTVGLGYGMVDLKLANKPLIVIGGEQRLTRRMALVTENWILPGTDHPLISLGLRFMGEWLSVDLALINTIGKDSVSPGIPYIDFVYNF